MGNTNTKCSKGGKMWKNIKVLFKLKFTKLKREDRMKKKKEK